MLDTQVLDPFSGVHEELATAYDSPYARIFARQASAAANPLAIPAGEPEVRAQHDVRTNLLSGLAAVAFTVLLFAGGVAALLTPVPANAVPTHVILL